MVARYAIQRPRIMTVVLWTGDNLAEIQQVWPSLPYSVTEAGALVTSMMEIPPGTWTDGQYGFTNEAEVEDYLALNQEVPTPGPYSYTVESV